MTMLSEKESSLLIIDIQEKLLNAVFNKDTLEKKASIAAKAANILDIPVMVTEQYPKGLGNTVSSVQTSLTYNYKCFEKVSFSALDNTDLAEHLNQLGRKQIVLFGIETHICVNQTAQALIQCGYDVSIISDACGSRNENEHNAGIYRMQEHGAHILTTEIAIFEWLRTAKHPNFKEIQNLIK